MLYQAYFWVKDFLGKFSREEGQGLVEYALILVLVSIVVIVVLQALGVEVGSIFKEITAKLSATPPAIP